MLIKREELSNRKTIRKEIWWKMVDYGLSEPVELHLADLSKPFVYDRALGFFYVPAAKHQAAMSLLLAWHLDLEDPFDIQLEPLGVHSHDSDVLADYFLDNIAGTCFKSSVSKIIYTGFKGSLNEREMDFFSSVKALR